MSQIALAEAIDQLVEANSAFVAESETVVTVSGLSGEHASLLSALCAETGWEASLVDRAGNVVPVEEAPDEDFGPFLLTIEKPASPAETLQLLTNSELKRWLARGHPALKWRVARLRHPIVSKSRVLLPWDVDMEAQVSPESKTPRALVREFGASRVPEDARPWLVRTLTEEEFYSPTVQVWAAAATQALTLCLPDEIDNDGFLKFRGPPRLKVAPARTEDGPLPFPTFLVLQNVMQWVFENEHESEMRHALLANELSRSSSSPVEGVAQVLQDHLSEAWSSAKIVYQVALSDTGRDTLKILSDLRKAITDETAKISDQSRQLVGAVAGSLATGIGLVAARIAIKASPEIVAAIMFVVVLYVASVITAAIHFIRLQRQMRTDWQGRLYRFLPKNDYDNLVEKPIKSAERALFWTAGLGSTAVLILAVVCGWPLLASTDRTSAPLDPSVESSAAGHARAHGSASSANKAPSTTRK